MSVPRKYGNFRWSCSAKTVPVIKIGWDFFFEKYASKNYSAGGLFSSASPPTDPQVFEKYAQIYPFSGTIFQGISAGNPQSSLFVDEQFKTAYDGLDWLQPSSLFDLARLETVNTHQWEGQQPIEHKARSGVVVWREDSLWDVRSVDSSTMNPILFLRGHVGKDYAFIVQQRLQAAIDYTLAILADWEDVAKRNARLKADKPEHLPPEHREEGEEMMQDILKQIEENPPSWQW